MSRELSLPKSRHRSPVLLVSEAEGRGAEGKGVYMYMYATLHIQCTV